MSAIHYRPAPTLGPSSARHRTRGGPTTESLVDMYMRQRVPQQPGLRRQHNPASPRNAAAGGGAAMDPETWWKLYVYSTQMRGIATLQHNFRKEAWAESQRGSPRNAPRPQGGGALGGGRPSPREARREAPRLSPRMSPRFHPDAARPAPQRPQQRRSAREAIAMAANYPPFQTHLQTPQPPPQKRSVAVQASPRESIAEVYAARVAPQLPPSARITTAELQQAQKALVDKLTTRFSTLQRAFNTIDTDRSGSITRQEFDFFLEVLNLHTAFRRPVIDKLFELIDYDKNGEFDFQEFVRVLTSDDVNNMVAIKTKVDSRGDQARRALEEKRKAQEKIAANVGLTVQEFCEYYGLKEIPV